MKLSQFQIGLREENFEKILIGNNFVTDDVLIQRNVTPYDLNAYWVTVPQYICYYNHFLVYFPFSLETSVNPLNALT